MEQWKSLNGYEGIYLISDYGRIKGLDRFDSIGRKITGKILKYQKNKDGYLNVTLRKNNIKQTYLVHRLVALNFIENPNDLLEVNHKDANKGNPKANNLEWCDRTYNVNYADGIEKRIKKQKKQVTQLDNSNKIINIFQSIKEAADKVNIPSSNITACCKGKRKMAAGYKWEYAM